MREMVDRACARNAPAELHFATTSSNEAHIARIRLIRIEGGELYADAPLSTDSQTTLSRRQRVIIHTMIDGTRYAFHTHVERVFTTVDLNAHKRISAITLAVPDSITQRQRRECFRISVAGHPDIPVAFCKALPDQPDCCALDAERFSGRLVNVSVGGLCVIVPVSRRRRFCQGERFFVEFMLPAVDEPFCLSAEGRHFRKVHENTDTLIGLRFRTDIAWPTKPLIQAISRFVADEERRQLRRGRQS